MKIRVIKKLLAISLVTLIGCSGDSSDEGQGSDQIIVEITLASLPATITYNKPSTPDGYVEYRWGVTFDINKDGVINTGNIVLRILHFKMTGSVEQTGTIEDLNASLWLYTTDTQTTRTVDATSTISGDTITISIDKNDYPLLNLVDNTTLVNFTCSTYDDSMGMSKYDYYPGSFSLTNIPANGQFTDPASDADFSYIDMEEMYIYF